MQMDVRAGWPAMMATRTLGQLHCAHCLVLPMIQQCLAPGAAQHSRDERLVGVQDCGHHMHVDV
jgi:hypothetical protein